MKRTLTMADEVSGPGARGARPWGPKLILMAVAALAALPAFGSGGAVNLFTEFLYFLALAQLWNLLAGYAGVVSLGQHAFVGIGGYALYASVLAGGIAPGWALAAAALAGAAAALLIAPVVFRLHGPHLAIGTWVIAEVFRLAIAQVETLGGNAGMSLPPDVAQSLDSSYASRDTIIYGIALLSCVAVHAGAYTLLRSRYGLALTSIRDNETAARSSGVSSAHVKWLVYVGVGLATAFIGALICLSKFRIAPSAAFDLNWTTYAIFIVVIGGVGTLEGPLVGTIVFFVLRQYLSDLGAWYLILLGGIAVAVMLRLPLGLWGTFAGRHDLHLFPTRRWLDAPGSPSRYPVARATDKRHKN